MRKNLVMAASVALAFAAAPAQAITFDFNGAAAGGVITDVQTFDWTPGNALAVGAVPVALGDTFTLLSHASLGNYLNSLGNSIAPNGGLGTAYEITYVISFLEQTTFSAGGFPGAATFQSIAGGVNFFEMWASPAVDSTMLAGTGFNNGTRILLGTVQPGGVGSFTATVTDLNGDGIPDTPLDSFGADAYPGLVTVGGAGGTIIDVVVQPIDYDLNYFPGGVGPMSIQFNTSQILPFNQTDPSALFTNVAGGGAPTEPGATIPSIGQVNGITGPNFIFQVDSNASVRLAQIPEPGTLGLLGLALGALGFAAKRRRS